MDICTIVWNKIHANDHTYNINLLSNNEAVLCHGGKGGWMNDLLYVVKTKCISFDFISGGRMRFYLQHCLNEYF